MPATTETAPTELDGLTTFVTVSPIFPLAVTVPGEPVTLVALEVVEGIEADIVTLPGVIVGFMLEDAVEGIFGVTVFTAEIDVTRASDELDETAMEALTAPGVAETLIPSAVVEPIAPVTVIGLRVVGSTEELATEDAPDVIVLGELIDVSTPTTDILPIPHPIVIVEPIVVVLAEDVADAVLALAV